MFKSVTNYVNGYFQKKQCNYLFLLSHMRSRSSLLAHILGSNPYISGYSEMHLSYVNKKDLNSLKKHNAKQDPYNISIYYIDKILHNHLYISSDLLVNKYVKCIFILRPADSTLKSIINMASQTEYKKLQNPINALKYYVSRIKELQRYAEIVKPNYYYLQSDDLIYNTDRTLTELSNWLNLETQLTKYYQLFSNTGKKYYGDPSDNIKKGYVINTNRHQEITIPADVLNTATNAYEECNRNLINWFINEH